MSFPTSSYTASSGKSIYHFIIHFTLQDQVILEMSNSTGFICDTQELIYLLHLFLQHTHYPGVLGMYKWYAWDQQKGGSFKWGGKQNLKTVKGTFPFYKGLAK